MANSFRFLFLFLFLALFFLPTHPLSPFRDFQDILFPLSIIPFDCNDPDPYNLEYLHRTRWIAFEERDIATSLAAIPGYKILSAILTPIPIRYLNLVHRFWLKNRNDTRLFIPTCDAVTIFILPLQQENQILARNPTILEDLMSTRRYVSRSCRRIDRFEGGGNITIGDPFIYRDESESVSVHGVLGFGSLELGYEDEDEDEFENKEGLVKLEVVTVANIVPQIFREEAEPWDAPFQMATLCTLKFQLND